MLYKHTVKLLVALALLVSVVGTNVVGGVFGIEFVPQIDAHAGGCSSGGGC